MEQNESSLFYRNLKKLKKYSSLILLYFLSAKRKCDATNKHCKLSKTNVMLYELSRSTGKTSFSYVKMFHYSP